MTASRIHLLLSALMGGTGVALWAMAAHRPGAASLVTAAHFLLFHAIAVMAITACRKQGLLHDRIVRIAVTGLIMGSLLFSGDLALRVFADSALFIMAAPLGGSLVIFGWLGIAVAALWSFPSRPA